MRADQPVAERAQPLAQLGRVEHREGKAQPDEVAGRPVHLVGPDPQDDVVTGVFHGGYVR